MREREVYFKLVSILWGNFNRYLRCSSRFLCFLHVLCVKVTRPNISITKRISHTDKLVRKTAHDGDKMEFGRNT